MLTIFVKFILVSTIFDFIANASYCDNLEQKYRPRQRHLSCNGINKSIYLYWNNDPSRAASALFAAFLRHRLGYQNVYLAQGPHYLQELAANVTHIVTRNYNEVILALSTSWKPAPPPEWIPNQGRKAGLAGPRLVELGASEIPVVLHLHLYLAAEFKYIELCTSANTWIFYTNTEALTHCGFVNKDSDGRLEKKTKVYYTLDEHSKKIMSELEKRALASSLHLKLQPINRTNLFRLIKTSNESFLFLDYDIWLEYPNVNMVQIPPCIPSNATDLCQQELDPAISMRVADVPILEEYAPKLLQAAQLFTLSPESLRGILELEDNNNSIEDAACEWVCENFTELKFWENNYQNIKKVYVIFFFYKADELQNQTMVITLLKRAIKEIDKEFEIFNAKFQIRIYTNNTDFHFVKNNIEYFMERGTTQQLLGAVVDAENMTEVAKNVDGANLPIILYGAPEVKANFTKSIWVSTGQSLHLILALQQFMINMNWRRLAIISEQTPMAKNFVDDLTTYLKNTRENESFAFRDHIVQPQLIQSEVIKLLQELKNIETARIILINTNSKDALTIMKAAKTLDMNEKEGYVWILREWKPHNLTLDIRHVTMSLWCQNNNNVRDVEGRKDLRDEIDKILSNYKRWPAKVTPIIDALLTLAYGFRNVFLKYPQAEYDVHSKFTLSEFNKSIHSMSIKGIFHNLTYKDRSLEESLVYLEEWYGEHSILIAKWRINTTSLKIYNEYELSSEYNKYAAVYDGATLCSVTFGDKYLPACYEMEIAIVVLLLVLSPPVLIVIYRSLKRRQEERVKKIMCDLIRQRQECGAFASNHLIERSALTMGQELGNGRFGRVRLAQINIRTSDGHRRQTVAVKYLHDDHSALELIREACTIAGLEHNHIIRFIGVSIDDSPPVLIMEYALFGDLLQYLQNRYYLAESENTAEPKIEEAAHVSPRALTRLARQAASALAYLCQQGIVHRDIRASNCLVDERRSLKLSDFGLARKVKTNDGEDDVKYKTFRCGVFPVLCMAPECISHGIFSTASDVWALGLLIFQIVTLGARPYGNMSPKAVYDFVTGGGQPSMPNDATPQTIALGHLCWKRKPEERPSAAEIVAYLAEHPCALSPAFKFPYEVPDSPDSGLGDSSTDILLMI